MAKSILVVLSGAALALPAPAQVAQLSPQAQMAGHGLALERVLPGGLGLGTPIDAFAIPGDPRTYLVDLSGKLHIIDAQGLVPTPFLDLTGIADVTLSTGLRGVAFHPDYASNGRLFLYYDDVDASGVHFLVLASLERSSSLPDQADLTTLTELLRFDQGIQGHGASGLRFGPDGKLYMAMGDGALRDDRVCAGQNHQNLMGTMIRLDVDGGFPYGIPADNPFVADPAVRDECWHLGFRHPWSWSFDPLTGDLWIADVGNDAWEEINRVPAGVGGRNFGWSVMEGNECFPLSACPPGSLPCFDPGYTAPDLAYDHFTGCSILGASVYRGSGLPDAYGRYFFADFCTFKLCSVRWDGTAIVDWQDHSFGLSSLNGGNLDMPVGFGVDAQGEILVFDFLDQEVFRLVPECSTEEFCPQPPGSAGQALTLRASGTPSLSTASLRLHVGNLVPGQVGQILYSAFPTTTPFGSGVLCIDVTAEHWRLPNFSANAAGRWHQAIDASQPPFDAGPGQLFAGTAWYFQTWARDGGAPPGLESVFSNALVVTFCP
ncbi:MAG: PQQ-dependent sugar dehydrogenase [Planctomycetota bacterium]